MRSRWYVRVPVKLLIFSTVTFFVLFPRPSLFIRHVERLRDLDALIEPDAPQLAALETELQERLNALPSDEPSADAAPDARRVQHEVERFVLERVEYAWDWDLWGAADYLPTIAEMFDKAAQTDGQLREDCDGRAVVAASLMRRLGYDAHLATDLRHVWVVTPQGEWMGPGDSKAIISDEAGNRLAFWTLAANVPMSLSYGIAVFPLKRELIILLTAFILMLHPRMSRVAAVAGLVLLIQGLLFMRLGYFSPQAVSGQASAWPAWVGFVHMLAGFGVLIITARRAARGEARACTSASPPAPGTAPGRSYP